MKKIIITALAIICSMNAFSQCPNTTGNYEFSISNNANTITIKARNTTAIIRSSYVNPAIDGNFVGLVFGIKWSAQSNIVLYKNTSPVPFDILSSGTIMKKNNFNFQSYGDAADALPMLSKEFMSGEWNVIAIIPYSGSLANDDKFELALCGFDETTDPYFAQMDKQGHYGQFSPNIVREEYSTANLALSNTVIVYPNPTMGNLFVDVSSVLNTTATFKVMNMTGHIVKTIQSDLKEGLNKVIVNVVDIADGMYLLKVVDGKALNYTQSFTKN